MNILKLFFGGALLTVLGVIVMFEQWSVAALISRECRNHWDVYSNCNRTALLCYASYLAPGPGLAMMALAIYRFVRWWGEPPGRPGRVDGCD